VTGSYRHEELPDLLAAARPHLIWFPALWPETYSYTLSAAMLSGAPIVAPNLGAFAERLSNRSWSWICPWDQSAADWSDLFVGLREAHFATGVPPPLALRAMTEGSVDWIPAYVNEGKRRSEASIHEHVILRLADAHTTPRLSMARHLWVNARHALLAAGLTVRSLPFLAGLMRRIPLSWQYRVRHWLVK
jgi:O-antigen biosynthesis protein